MTTFDVYRRWSLSLWKLITRRLEHARQLWDAPSVPERTDPTTGEFATRKFTRSNAEGWLTSASNVLLIWLHLREIIPVKELRNKYLAPELLAHSIGKTSDGKGIKIPGGKWGKIDHSPHLLMEISPGGSTISLEGGIGLPVLGHSSCYRSVEPV